MFVPMIIWIGKPLVPIGSLYGASWLSGTCFWARVGVPRDPGYLIGPWGLYQLQVIIFKSEQVSIYNLYRDYIYIWLYRIIGIYLTEDGLLVVCWWVVCLVCYQGGWSSWAGIFSHWALGLGQGDVHKQRKELWWIILFKTILYIYK